MLCLLLLGCSLLKDPYNTIQEARISLKYSSSKSICCSCRRLECGFKNPHGDSQLSVTSGPEDLAPSSDFHGLLHHMVHTHTILRSMHKNNFKRQVSREYFHIWRKKMIGNIVLYSPTQSH